MIGFFYLMIFILIKAIMFKYIIFILIDSNSNSRNRSNVLKISKKYLETYYLYYFNNVQAIKIYFISLTLFFFLLFIIFKKSM